MVHELPAAKLLPQVFVCAKSPALLPVKVRLEMLSPTDWLFWMTKLFMLLAVLTATLPKFADAGVRVTSATPVALTEEGAALRADNPLSFTAKPAVSALSMLGINVTPRASALIAARRIAVFAPPRGSALAGMQDASFVGLLPSRGKDSADARDRNII